MEAVLEKKESTKKLTKKKIAKKSTPITKKKTSKKTKPTTGNFQLDLILPMLSEKNLQKLADYARYLRWLSIENDEDDDDDGSWADLPLTPEEEAQVAESIEDFKNGKYLTLEELVEGL